MKIATNCELSIHSLERHGAYSHIGHCDGPALHPPSADSETKSVPVPVSPQLDQRHLLDSTVHLLRIHSCLELYLQVDDVPGVAEEVVGLVLVQPLSVSAVDAVDTVTKL